MKLLSSIKFYWNIFSNLVCFSECPKFNMYVILISFSYHLNKPLCISNSLLNSIVCATEKNQDPLILGNSTIVVTLMHCDCSTTRRDFLLNVLVSRQMITNASHFRSAFLYSANFCTIQRKDLYVGVLQYFRRIWSWFLMQLYY